MKELEELADALARRHVEHEPEEGLPFGDHVAAAITAGRHDVAAAAILLARRAGRPYSGDVPAETEAAIKRQQALTAAGNFRRINKANHTNHALPAWIRSELGVNY